ncbi:MAG: hypothetical protein HY903_17925 [Deltaproteobacteria bacterium]|nr:hypothetical protein [Deltaproteobacteria bacterium]
MATPGTSPKVVKIGRHALDRFRDLVTSGAFTRAAVVDRQTGELIDPEARALFASLPAVTPATTVDELIDQGLISKPPRELQRAAGRPRYRPGRSLFVKAPTSFTDDRRGPVASYAASAPPAFSHRGVLKAKRGDDFMVELPGAPTLLPFARSDVFAWNEPRGVPATGATISGVQIDYNDPLMKAHLSAALIESKDDIAALDFSADDAEVTRRQHDLLHRLASRVRMTYVGRGAGYAGHRAGSLLVGGQGVCFVQRAVTAALLQPFTRLLGFELMLAVGKTLKHDVPHGFLVLTLRPALTRLVCDPAWAEPATDLRVAFFDSGWGHDRRLVGFEAQTEGAVAAADVDLPDMVAA